MKRFYFTVFSLVILLVACNNSLPKAEQVKEQVSISGAPATNTSKRYKLYPTDNMWTFVKLDTFKGVTYQVQWSTKPDDRAVIPIQ